MNEYCEFNCIKPVTSSLLRRERETEGERERERETEREYENARFIESEREGVVCERGRDRDRANAEL